LPERLRFNPVQAGETNVVGVGGLQKSVPIEEARKKLAAITLISMRLLSAP
jgi:hypothetical protein